MNNLFFIKSYPLLLLLLIVGGCDRRPLNLTLAKEQVMKYYESCEYEKELEEIINKSYQHFPKPAPHIKLPTVIFDIDETVLSSYCDMKDIEFGYVPKLSHEWIERADAPVIPTTKKFYDYLVALGYRIIFMTGRKHNEYDATIKNLTRCGFGTFDKLIVRSKENADISAAEFKAKERARLVAQGYTIIGCIGDQLSDCVGCHTGHFVKIPNYLYTIN